MSTESLLFIVVTVCLIVFLVVAIMFLIQLIQISRSVRSLSEKVDDAADNIVSVSSAFRKIATPLAVTSIISKFADKVMHPKKKRSKRHE